MSIATALSERTERAVGRPRCPRCETHAVRPCSVMLDAPEETVWATHECVHCRTRFRYTPGTATTS